MNLILCTCGNYNFLIEEENVEEVIVDLGVLSDLPNSKDWVVGLANYRDDAIVVVDLANLLDITSDPKSNHLFVIVKKESYTFALRIDHAQSVSSLDLISSFTYDIENSLYFKNILSDRFNIYFKLNIPQIYDFIKANLDFEHIWTDWTAFFDAERNEKAIPEISYEQGMRANYIFYQVGEFAFLTPFDNLEEIREAKPSETFQDVSYRFYQDRWIPSINLSQIFRTADIDPVYAVILSYEGEYYELLATTIELSTGGPIELGASVINNIANPSFQYGISGLFQTEEGYAYQFNPLEFIEKYKKDVGFDIFQPEMVFDESEVELISSESGIYTTYTSIFSEEETEMFLFIDQEDNDNSVALSANEIIDFTHKHPEHHPVVSWTEGTLNSRIFYSKEVDGKKIYFEIPSSSYLRAVKKEIILDEGENLVIKIDSQEIPIRKH